MAIASGILSKCNTLLSKIISVPVDEAFDADLNWRSRDKSCFSFQCCYVGKGSAKVWGTSPGCNGISSRMAFFPTAASMAAI
jgi:hypothetical protein